MSSWLADGSDPKPQKPTPQAEIETAELVLDYQHVNIELDLRISAVKAIAAANSISIGFSDENVEGDLRTAAAHMREAVVRFNAVKTAIAARGCEILAAAIDGAVR